NIKTLDFCGLSSKHFGSVLTSLAEYMGRLRFVQDYEDDDEKADLLIPKCKKCSITRPSTCKHISSEAITSLIIRCENLRVFNIYDIATAISEYDLITILRSQTAKRFQSLDLGLSYVKSHVLHAIQYIDLTGVKCLTPISIRGLLDNLQKNHSLHTVEMSKSLLKNLCVIKGWKINDNFSIRYCYTKLSHGEGRVHLRKLDVAESGLERMSKIFKYYSFDV
ncbi:8882_t:CDS:2, partial [Funneliformis mosseae]